MSTTPESVAESRARLERIQAQIDEVRAIRKEQCRPFVEVCNEQCRPFREEAKRQIDALRKEYEQVFQNEHGGDPRYGMTAVVIEDCCRMSYLGPVVPVGTRLIFIGMGTDSGGYDHRFHLLDGPPEVMAYYNNSYGLAIPRRWVKFDEDYWDPPARKSPL